MGMNTASHFGFSSDSFKLFPTIDHSYLTNDGYCEEDSFLDIDYQEADYGNDLDLASPNCKKSAQHNDYIDINDLNINDLPPVIQDAAVVVWIRYSAQLVVRLSRKVNATGRAFVIDDHIKRKVPCKNQRCVHRSSFGDNHMVHGGLGIITNKHVVKNDDEAKEAKVEFFYHDSDDRYQVVKENGNSIHVTNNNMDYTVFTCNMHHPDLIQVIQLCTDISRHAWRCIPISIREKLKTFAIVISHPHGTSKKVSIGNVIGSELRSDSKYAVSNLRLLRKLYEVCEKNKYSMKRFAIYFSLMKDITVTVRVTYYNAATCPGSSGAPVYTAHTVMENNEEINPPHTHRGKHPVNGYNNCYI